LIGEAVSFPYATRLIAPAHTGIKSRKDALPIAALPATRNKEFIKIVQEAIPEAILSSDTLSVGFNNVNPTSHVAFYLFNLGRVESPDAKNSDFHSWGTPTVVRIQYEMDAERLAVMNEMHLKTISFDEFHQICYHNKHYKPIPQAGEFLPSSASQVPDRFIDEDVPMGLVAISDFGKKLGLITPTIDVLIQMANLVRKKNFAIEGTTLLDMGIDGMSIDEILAFVMGK